MTEQQPQEDANVEDPKNDAKPIEIVYKFPKKEEEVISKMTITVGDKTIEGKIMEKEKA